MSSTTDQQIRWVLYNAETKLQSIPVNHEEIQWTVMRMKQLDWKKYYIWRDGWQNWQQLDTYLRSSQKEIHVEFKKLENEEAKDDTKTETTATVKVDRFNIETTPDKIDASKAGHVASNASIKNFDPNKKSAKPEGKPKVASKGNIFDTSRPATKNTTFVDWDDQLAKLFVESAQDFSGDSVGAATNTVNDPSRNPISFKEEKLAKKTYENRAERHTLKIEVLFINSKGKTFKSFSKNISLSGTLIDDDIPTSFFESKFEIIIINRFAKTTQNSRLQLFAKCPILSAPNRIQFIDVKDQQKAKLKSLLEQYLVDQKQMMSRAS